MKMMYTNQTSIYEGTSVFAEHKDKDQATGLEIRVIHIMQSSGVQDAHQEQSHFHSY
jgi:hypothetical protein